MNDSVDTMNTLLRALGDRLGATLAADDEGACGLRVDGRLLVTLECDPPTQTLLLSAETGELPADGASPVMLACPRRTTSGKAAAGPPGRCVATRWCCCAASGSRRSTALIVAVNEPVSSIPLLSCTR